MYGIKRALMSQSIICAIIIMISSCGGSGAHTGEIDLDAIGKQVMLLHENVQKEIAESPETPGGLEKVVPKTINHHDGVFYRICQRD